MRVVKLFIISRVIFLLLRKKKKKLNSRTLLYVMLDLSNFCSA